MPRTPDRTRLQGIEPEHTHQQVLREGDYWMYRRHWTSWFHHFYHAWPHFWILASANGWQLPKVDSIHNSRQRSVRLDHVTHGTTGMSSQFPTTYGGSSPRYSQCLHRWLTHTHKKHLEVLDKVLAHLHKNYLKNASSETISSHLKRFGLQIQTTARSGITDILCTTEATHLRTGDDSQKWTGNTSSSWMQPQALQSSRQPQGHPHPSWQGGKFLCILVCISPIEGTQKNTHPSF